jgi:uncharacterized membrane protein
MAKQRHNEVEWPTVFMIQHFYPHRQAVDTFLVQKKTDVGRKLAEILKERDCLAAVKHADTRNAIKAAATSGDYDKAVQLWNEWQIAHANFPEDIIVTEQEVRTYGTTTVAKG